jgi:hypothetical protein
MLFFDLMLKPDSWTALLFGADTTLPSDMVLWTTTLEDLNGDNIRTSNEVVPTTQDAHWLGTLLAETASIDKLLIIEDEQNLSQIVNGVMDEALGLYSF